MKSARPQHAGLYALIALMVCCWSINFVVAKVALREFPPLMLVGVRMLMAGLCMLPVYWWEGRTVTDRWKRSDVPALMGLGILGIAANQVLFVCGLNSTTVAHSAIIVGLTPLFVLVSAAMIGLERLTLRKIGGMLLALGGVAVLKVMQDDPADVRGPTLLGDAMVLTSSFAFALFTVFGKRIAKRHTSITVNTFAYVGAALAMLPVTLWWTRNLDVRTITFTAWASVTYMAVFPSVVCYLIYYYALARIPASRVSSFSYFQPLLATLLAVAVLGEHLSASIVAGGGIIFTGIYMTERG